MKTWFEQKAEQERRDALRLWVGIFCVILACVAIASLVMSGAK